MRGLFVTLNGIKDEAFGGAKASIRNYEALRNVTSQMDVVTIKKRSNGMSLLSGMQGNYPPILNEDQKKILHLFEENHYDFVFFDSSAFGKSVKLLRKHGANTIVFFHNCESDYNKVRFGNGKGLKARVYQKLIDQNEKIAAESATKSAVFTVRDKKRIESLYNVSVTSVIPVGMCDIFDGDTISEQCENYCLLLGPAQAANIEGFGWFVKNVSPHLNCKTLLIGRGFEEYGDRWHSEKVQVLGYVKDIRPYYRNARCVAIPLFSGAGMKLKTVEALMFGKYVFGTDEAFVGFDFDDEKVGGRCNSKEEYIDKINYFLVKTPQSFNTYSRELFKNNYSIEASTRAFEQLVCDVGN